MKFPKFFKGKTGGATVHASSSSDSGSAHGSPSPGSKFEFNHVASGTRSRKVVNTVKILRVCGVDSQEDIERINALQSECINDSTDTSFEDDAHVTKQTKQQEHDLDLCGRLGGGRRLLRGFMEQKDDHDDVRKSDFSLHSADDSRSLSPSWMSTPQHSPRAQTPLSSPMRDAGRPLRLPTPPGSPPTTPQPLRSRAGSFVPSPLPLPRRGTSQTPLSPSSSPLRSPRSQMLSPQMSPQRSPSSKCPQSWEKVQELGRGSFGTVYKGLNKEDGSYFAVKVIRDSSALEEIQQEVAILSKLDHPNIVRYLGSCMDKDGELCIFLELMMNSVKSVLVSLGKGFEERTIRNYVRQLLNGLVYLHEHNTIHRDIKCANILVNASGHVKLADFGVAKQMVCQLASSVKGSPFYMAPEMISPIQQQRSYGTPVDIWSLGCTILEMANGKEPWADIGLAFYFKLSRGQHPPIPDHLSPALKDFILCCLRFKPEERPTASKLLQHHFLTETTISNYVTPLSSPRQQLSSFLQQEVQPHTIQGLRRNGNLNFNNSAGNNISATLLYRDGQVIIRSPHTLDIDFQGILM